MGLAPSRTSLYLPSETLRVCNPDHCWCNTSHGHRTSKYIYVERGGDGRERYQDPVDMMAEFMMGAGNGGGGMGLPWKSPSEWSVRDFERLGEVLNEFRIRERGRAGGGNGGDGRGFPPGMPWDDFNGLPGGGGGGGGVGGRRRRTYPSWSEFERMQESVEEKFRRMVEEHQRHLAERDAMLFGSHEDRKREQYQRHMLKTLQEIMPQLSQMIAAQQMGGGMGGAGVAGGMMPPMAMPMAGGMPQAMGGVGMGMPHASMAGVHPGMMAGLVNPMPGFAGMGGQGVPMMGGDGMAAGGMNGMGDGFGRRGRGRRARFAQRDDFDDEFGGLGGGRGGRGFGRGARSWDDEDDMFGRGGGGDGGFNRRDPRPRRPGGDLGGGGRVASPNGFVPTQHQVPLRSPRRPFEAHTGLNGQTDFSRSDGLNDLPTDMPTRNPSTAGPGMQSSPPPPPPPVWPQRMPPSYSSARMPEGPLAYDSTLPPTYTSGPLDGSPLSPGLAPRVRFAGHSMSAREAEEAGRREPDAGGTSIGEDL